MSIGKPIAVVFTFAALMILAGSFVAPHTVAASNDGCSPAYGIDPCTTGSIPQAVAK